ncbi:MAG: hypothetical protein IBX61_02675 [Thermoleophilia bacterium]|nr:hypothetical protein [Thermoleophilia bacterium]
MQSGYPGLDLAQVIFAVAMLMVLIGFAYWGWQAHGRIKKLERQLRDFKELEPEGYEEEEGTDALSEGARIQADEEQARQRDILEHG